MRITVTIADINQGQRHSCMRDPIALAIYRADPTRQPYVNAETVVMYTGARVIRREMPPVAQEWVRRWDAGYPVEPIEFELGDGT